MTHVASDHRLNDDIVKKQQLKAAVIPVLI